MADHFRRRRENTRIASSLKSDKIIQSTWRKTRNQTMANAEASRRPAERTPSQSVKQHIRQKAHYSCLPFTQNVWMCRRTRRAACLSEKRRRKAYSGEERRRIAAIGISVSMVCGGRFSIVVAHLAGLLEVSPPIILLMTRNINTTCARTRWIQSGRSGQIL